MGYSGGKWAAEAELALDMNQISHLPPCCAHDADLSTSALPCSPSGASLAACMRGGTDTPVLLVSDLAHEGSRWTGR